MMGNFSPMNPSTSSPVDAQGRGGEGMAGVEQDGFHTVSNSG